MTEGLKHNIAAMRQTHRLPSFEQVLVTLEDALTEIERLNIRIRQDAEKALSALNEIDQLTGSKAALQAEIERLRELHDELYEESQHRLEMLQRQKAEIERLTALVEQRQALIGHQSVEVERLQAVCKDKTTLLRDAYAEVDRLKAERHTTKMMLHDILDKHIPKKPVD